MTNPKTYHPLEGARFMLLGFRCLNHPALRPYVLVPLLINSCFFASLFAFGYHTIHRLSQWLMQALPDALSWLTWLLWPLFCLGALLFIYYTFAILANLLAAPFNGLLAEKTQQIFTPLPIRETSLLQMLADLPSICKRQASWLCYYLPRALAVILCFFVPPIQIIAPLLWLLFNAWMLSIQCFDYAFDNNRKTFAQTKRFVQTEPYLALSFGLAFIVCTLIPFINFFALPAAVIGATQLWAKHSAVS